MKRIFTLVLSVIMFGAIAQKVDVADTKRIAQTFIQSKNISSDLVQIVHHGVYEGDTLYYVYNAGSDGFVIVSGEYSLPPVLAWSDEDRFYSEHINPGLEMWLMMYAETAKASMESKSSFRHPEWDIILYDYSGNKEKEKGVSPLLSARWNQDTYYNDQCPEHSAGPNGHCYAGCVATAMSMVMYYHKYPVHGQGSNSYYHPYYTTITESFADATYDWGSMTDVINYNSKDAIALLMYHCGVSVDMYYTPTGSSATTIDAAWAFQHNFNYRGTLKVEYKNGYDEYDWRFILNNELEENRPVFYSGYGDGGGHAFVCDGYSDTLYHFNWGWGGYNNGYFRLNDMSFSLGQTAIVGVAPETADYCFSGREYNDTSRTFSDGSDASYYWNNTDCSWLIQPSNGPVVLTFTSFNTEAGKDIVRVYEGTDETGQLLGEYSGTSMPPVLEATSGSIFITFITDSFNQGHGWTAMYTSGLAGLEDKILIDGLYYPNPAQNELFIETPDPGEIINEVRIYTFDGKLCSKTYVTKNNSIDISSLPQGVYLIVSLTDTHKYVGRVIKE
ncbi:MAG: hypothetical protein C0592_03755 [Marinilabiliales bacterium]|nr:MAG: hypothetical protein C0592_03755 [Marinilabiliales bacterium]